MSASTPVAATNLMRYSVPATTYCTIGQGVMMTVANGFVLDGSINLFGGLVIGGVA